MIAVNTHSAERVNSFFNTEPLTLDCPSSLSSPSTSSPETGRIPEQPDLAERMQASDANYGKPSVGQNADLMATLEDRIKEGLFQADPKPVPACMDGDQTLSHIDESRSFIAENQRRLSPDKPILLGRNSRSCSTVGSSGLPTDPGQLKPCASRRTEYCGLVWMRQNSIVFSSWIAAGWKTSLHCSIDCGASVTSLRLTLQMVSRMLSWPIKPDT